jgi:alkane 1-monooxygenase
MNASYSWRCCGYLVGLAMGWTSIVTSLVGGPWTLAPLVVLIVIEFADWLTRDDERPQAPVSPRIADGLLLAHVFTHTATVLALLYGVQSGILEKTFIWYAAIGVGMNSGSSGIVCAHELIHRNSRWLRALGVWNLLLVNYGHFRVEHMIHHRFVGTLLDPTTARRGESVYYFMLRTIPQQFWQSLRSEGERVRRRGKLPYGPANFVVCSTALQLAICGAMFVVFGTRLVQVYLLQSLIAVMLLEIINYVEHYGLERQPGEPLRSQHSWGTDKVASRFSLLELTRHADHHLHASRPYVELESHHESPRLPSGYWGMAHLALVPPLWFWIIDRRIPQPASDAADSKQPMISRRAA